MGLAINGKIVQSSGLTYFSRNNGYSKDTMIDTGYINPDGTTKLTSIADLSIFDLVAPGTYLTDLDTLQHVHNFSGFMGGYHFDDSKVPVLIHVPEGNLVKYDNKNALTLLAYLCYLSTSNKVEDTQQNNDILAQVYDKLNTEDMMRAGLIQPPVEELVNFTFSKVGGKPVSVNDFLTDNVDNIVDSVYYKGKEVDFYYYAGIDSGNLSNRMLIYIGGGYGFSVLPDYETLNVSNHSYVYMKLSDPDKDGVIAVYDCSKYHIQVNKGLTGSSHTIPADSNTSFHNYSLKAHLIVYTNGTYDAYVLAFSTVIPDEKIYPLGFKYIDINILTDVPYNPSLFDSICLNNESNWFDSNDHNLMTLPQQFNLNLLGFSFGSGYSPGTFNAGLGKYTILPQGKYLVNSSSIKGDLLNSPVLAADIDYIEVKSYANRVVEQKVYLRYGWSINYCMYSRISTITESGVPNYSDWHSCNINHVLGD